MFANQVAFLTCSKMGAGPSMPYRDELEEFFYEEEVKQETRKLDE